MDLEFRRLLVLLLREEPRSDELTALLMRKKE
jgi:hypothetical protein